MFGGNTDRFLEGYNGPVDRENEKEVVVSIVNHVLSTIDKAMDHFFNSYESNNEEECNIFAQLRPTYDALSFRRKAGQFTVKSRVLAHPNRAQDFVDGTTEADNFQHLLGHLPPNEGRRFVDFGCGDGNLLLSIALTHLYQQPTIPMFKEVIGIELDHARATEALLKLEYLATKVADQYGIIVPKYAVYEDDFHSVALPSQVHVIYACTTCFTEETRLVVLRRAADLLQPGGSLILLDWKLSDEMLSSFGFVHTEESLCRTSWGTGIAYVYMRTERLF